ncbi:MAG TPA: methyl-accepting chemotaxis protein [Telluria sp.]|nr:methyl-accepting chemotaxis protein [Telluria sp.]
MRLRLGFGMMLAMLVGTIAINDVVGTRNREATNRQLAVSREKLELTNVLKAAQLEAVVAIRTIGLQSDVGAMNREEAKLHAQQAKVADARKQLLALGASDGARQIFARLDQIEANLKKPTSDAIQAALSFNQDTAGQIIASRVDPLYQQELAELNKLVALNKTEAQQDVDEGEASARRLKYILIGIGVATAVFGWLLARLITHSITSPINFAVSVAQRVAEGDLSSQIEVRGADETADLLRALADMNRNLVKVVHEVRTGTDTIASAAVQIASGNQDLASRTEEHAGSLQSAVAAVEELTGTVHQNTASAGKANQLAESASSVALKGGEVVAQVVDTMGSINTSANKIVDIIGVIDGIAFQTNILALNAAVEAARAGEQGRGFAVVASEVRNLAQRSASAAKEIKSLIEDSVQKIENGHRLVAQAGTTMNDIVVSVQKVTDIMAEITSASESQSHDIDRLNETIASIDDGTRQNATLVEEAAASASSLSEMATSLDHVVSIFKLGDEARTPALRVVEGGAARPAAVRPAAVQRRLTGS